MSATLIQLANGRSFRKSFSRDYRRLRLPSRSPAAALEGDNVVVFEQGFSNDDHWLKAHRNTGSNWVTEDVADLAFLSHTCTPGSAPYRSLQSVTAADNLGQPHILFASRPANDSQAFEDHYRTAAGWQVRSFPLSHGRPLDMLIDENGATHIIAQVSSEDTSRLIYIRVDADAW